MICTFERRDKKTPERRCSGGGHVTTEAEVGVMRPQAWGHLESLKATAGRNDPPLEHLKGAWPFYTFWSQIPEKIHSYCFKLSDSNFVQQP